jgi:membrane-associated phospholipid phosphatase
MASSGSLAGGVTTQQIAMNDAGAFHRTTLACMDGRGYSACKGSACGNTPDAQVGAHRAGDGRLALKIRAMAFIDPSLPHFWHLVTRLGEAQILLPAALLAAFALQRRPEGRPLVVWWFALLGAAVLLTTASKVAFIGWGIGWPELNFTGISGHAMFAAAVYPLLLGTLGSRMSPLGRRLAIGAGGALALLVGESRIVVGAHSSSEVLAGLLVGAATSATALYLARLPRARFGPVIPVAMALWLALMPAHAGLSRTHSMVTKLSLMLSGRSTPYTRGDMHREWQRRQSEPCRMPVCASQSESATET